MKHLHGNERQLTTSRRRMNLVPMLWLAAVLASPLHAQVCSGGAGGGMDATGNQCNDAPALASSVPSAPAATVPSAPATSKVSVQQAGRPARPTPVQRPPAKCDLRAGIDSGCVFN